MDSNKNSPGFSIIELMIAITLGMIMMAAALQFMVSSRSIYEINNDISRIQENGRIALNLISNSLRSAGYPLLSTTAIGITSATMVDAVLKECVHSNGNIMPCATDGGANNSDTLSIQFYANPNDKTDCLGNALTNSNNITVNSYSIRDPESDGVNSLYCGGFDATTGIWISAPQPLLDGIDNLQVLYRIDDGSRAEYKSFDRLAVNEFATITAIRVGVLVGNGLATGNAGSKQRHYQLLDSAAIHFPNDRQPRRIYSTTVQLPNSFSDH